MKFKEYMLVESTMTIADAAETVAAHLQGDRAAKVREIASMLQAGIDAGQIYNAQLTEIKDFWGWNFDRAYDPLYYRDKDTDEALFRVMYKFNYDFSPHIDGGNYKKQLKLMQSYMPHVPPEHKAQADEMLKLLEAYAVFMDGVKSLKDKTLKGRKPAPIDPNKFVNKVGSQASQDLVRKHLLSNISGPLDEFEGELVKYFQGEVDHIAQQTEIEQRDLDYVGMMILQSCFDYKVIYDRGRIGNRTYAIKGKNDRAAKWPATEAKRMRTDMQEGFLAKNIQKLSNIIDLKGNLTKIVDLPSKPVVVRSGKGSLEAGFTFFFDDGSEFSVINKIITNYSMQGKAFYQYPTTFHNVKLADGTKLAMPSEEKMVKGFAK